ncbi:hypothetical protein B1H58_14455 [Pantoea alhagi]|uniref:Uncharacterized protein n=1 Tax=Pantoea alhagi TaxID=1891675 RepID=A0A1W6B7T9_9GAMM|nr:hypothetical protein B1H58_14455 [Pantoea alhagi]
MLCAGEKVWVAIHGSGEPARKSASRRYITLVMLAQHVKTNPMAIAEIASLFKRLIAWLPLF